jgi:hypothetical protein
MKVKNKQTNKQTMTTAAAAKFLRQAAKYIFLISNFHHVLNVVWFLLGNSPGQVPTHL